MSATLLWTADAMREAMRAGVRGALPHAVTGISIDSRTLKPGDADVIAAAARQYLT